MKEHRSHQKFSHQKKVRLIKNKNKKNHQTCFSLSNPFLFKLSSIIENGLFELLTPRGPLKIHMIIIIQVCKHFDIKPKKILQIIHYTHYINELDSAKNPLIFMYG